MAPAPAEVQGTASATWDAPHLRRVFTEDFSTPVALGGLSSSPYAASWAWYNGHPDTSHKGWHDPASVISVSGGVLDWYVHTSGGEHRVAAMLPRLSSDALGQTYGRYAFRFRADVLPGYKIAFLLWPDSENWGEGEIDFPEADGLTADHHIYSALHPIGDLSAGRPGRSINTFSDVPVAGSGWHEAIIDWTPGRVAFYLDGELLAIQTTGVPSTAFHLVFQVETALSGPEPADDVAGHIQVDWLNIYAYEPCAASPAQTGATVGRDCRVP